MQYSLAIGSLVASVQFPVFDNIPDEIIVKIGGYFDYETLRVFSQLSKKFYRCSSTVLQDAYNKVTKKRECLHRLVLKIQNFITSILKFDEPLSSVYSVPEACNGKEENFSQEPFKKKIDLIEDCKKENREIFFCGGILYQRVKISKNVPDAATCSSFEMALDGEKEYPEFKKKVVLKWQTYFFADLVLGYLDEIKLQRKTCFLSAQIIYLGRGDQERKYMRYTASIAFFKKLKDNSVGFAASENLPKALCYRIKQAAFLDHFPQLFDKEGSFENQFIKLETKFKAQALSEFEIPGGTFRKTLPVR